MITPGSETGTVQKGNTEAYNESWLATGSGEPPGTAIGSAMANAFFDATGVRIRQAPMRPEVVRGYLKAARDLNRDLPTGGPRPGPPVRFTPRDDAAELVRVSRRGDSNPGPHHYETRKSEDARVRRTRLAR